MKWLKDHSSKATLDGMARYALPSDKALGVTYRDMKALGKRLGQNHELAAALWETDVYEARMLASMVDDPAEVTSAQMDRWCKDFDNWGICDTMYLLANHTARWPMVCGVRREFVNRFAYILGEGSISNN